ncbi:hypothetical protein AVEN_238652-1 [Araneus ventricosus]|uniref:Uncharacterized protein n=1 Tax=Araneus ventricosus TaxID=182803 RepID=A0A4Y2KR67_ARAVE|nr:hypothetical protein AVEN_238652-1 [Araneus ventricosus]
MDPSFSQNRSHIEKGGKKGLDSDENKDEDNADIEKTIGSFYTSLVAHLMKKFSIQERDISFAIQCMIRLYKKVKEGELRSDVEFNEKETCIGYLFRYAACHTALVLKASTTVFDSPDNKLNLKLENTSLNIMFLGGGPGNDALGFLLFLYGKHEYIRDLSITVVDKKHGWEEFFKEIIDLYKRIKIPTFMRERNIFKCVNVISSFIAADLTNSSDWSDEELLNKLKHADVVFFVKSLSNIPDTMKSIVLQNVNENIKAGCLLIYIDCPYPHKLFSSMESSLKLVYKDERKKYDFDFQHYKFNYEMINSCHAEVRMFQKL